MANVTFRGVTKRYKDGPKAVDDLNLEIEDGEFMVLVGPSGCGKSTALRMIAGLEEISDGQLRIGERVVNDVPPGDRDIAMVFQNYALYPHMTVRENIGFALEIARVKKAEITRPGSSRRPRCWVSPSTSIGCRRPCRAANASASPWGGRSSGHRRCS